MLWLWRKETVIWEGFEGISDWKEFPSDWKSVVKSWLGSVSPSLAHSRLSPWRHKHGLADPQTPFHALLGSLHPCSQQCTYPGIRGWACPCPWGTEQPPVLAVGTLLGAAAQHRSTNWVTGLGSLSQHSWHSTESRLNLERALITRAVTSPGYYPAGISFPPSAEDMF